MTAIRINYADRKIILSSAFEKRAFTPGTVEYDQFQAYYSVFAMAEYSGFYDTPKCCLLFPDLPVRC